MALTPVPDAPAKLQALCDLAAELTALFARYEAMQSGGPPDTADGSRTVGRLVLEPWADGKGSFALRLSTVGLGVDPVKIFTVTPAGARTIALAYLNGGA